MIKYVTDWRDEIFRKIPFLLRDWQDETFRKIPSVCDRLAG